MQNSGGGASIVFIIPTRNRYDLVVRAFESICAQRETSRVHIIVSDNSTDRLEVEKLVSFFAKGNYAGSELIRPPSSLNMTQHWSWAIAYALANTAGTHFAFLTDRMLLRPGQLQVLEQLCTSYPDQLISYTYDRIGDVSIPITFFPLPRSGLVYRLDSKALLENTSRMAFSSCLPRMLNSIAPRNHLENMIGRFGGVFGSMSPDYCFCFRSLAITDSILYIDKSILLNYGHSRSNGASVSRGVRSKDYSDYLANMGSDKECHLCPLPDVITTGNGVMHEYVYVGKEMGQGIFPEINLECYRNYLAAEVLNFTNIELRDSMLTVLTREGWAGTLLFWVRLFNDRVMRKISAILCWRFQKIDDCIGFALSKQPVGFSWLKMIIKRYGKDVVAL